MPEKEISSRRPGEEATRFVMEKWKTAGIAGFLCPGAISLEKNPFEG
jgi:hypothetical protein